MIGQPFMMIGKYSPRLAGVSVDVGVSVGVLVGVTVLVGVYVGVGVSVGVFVGVGGQYMPLVCVATVSRFAVSGVDFAFLTART